MSDMGQITSITHERKIRLKEKLERELGLHICDLLQQPDVIEIMLNPDSSLWVERLGGEPVKEGYMPASQAEALMATMASHLRTVITRENPIIECELPLDGSRFEGLLPPVVTAPTFTIRKKAGKVFTLDEYVASGIMHSHQRKAINQAVIERKNILVVGGTGTGKTTLTNAIIQEITDCTPSHRIVIIEDTAEIQCQAQNYALLRATDCVDMQRLLKATMRLRPDRILVGEVRGPEALALLKAWNTGHPGGIATVHANHAAAGLIRLEQLIAEASTSPMQTLIGEAVDLVISIKKTDKGRYIDEILSVDGFDSVKGHYLLNHSELN
jgi:type IV secretion system protein VirB11